MPHQVAGNSQKCRGGQDGDVHPCECDQGRRVFRRFRRRKLIIGRCGVLAALVRGCRWNTLASKAAIGTRATGGAGREAVKRPDEQDYYHQADCDVKSTSHPDLG